jgi:hypothetical protein
MAVTQQQTVFSYVASGGASFGFGCRVLVQDDLIVQVDGVEQFSPAFTVTGLGDSSGGTVTFHSAPTAGSLVRIQRATQIIRTTDYQVGGDFEAATVNLDFDRVYMLCQDVLGGSVEIANTLRVPAGETIAVLPAKAARANTLAAFDGNGDPTIGVPVSGSAADVMIQYAKSFGSSLIGYIQAGIGAVARTLQSELRDVIKVKQFGAVGDGVADDTAAIQRAMDAITAGGKPRTLVFQDGCTYRVTATLYRDVSLVGIDARGTIIDISGVTAGPAFIQASSGAFGTSGAQSIPWIGGKIAGNSTATRVAFQYGTLTNVHGLLASMTVSALSFDHLGFANVDVCENYVNQCFDITHIACEYEACGQSTAVLRLVAGGANYGENIVYAAGTAFHNCGLVLKQDYAASQFNFSQCTFDYCSQFFNVNNGFCIASSCYFEWSNDTAIQFIAANDALIVIENPIMSVTGPRANFDIFQSNTNLGTGFNKGQGLRSGIFVRGGTIGLQNIANRKFLCTGTGAATFQGIDYSGFALSQSASPFNCISAYSNLLNNGNFATGIIGWTGAGTVNWNSGGGNPGGSLQLTYDQATCSAYIEFSARGGDSVVATYDIALSGFVSRFVNIHLIAYDIAGAQLVDSFSNLAGQDSFTGTLAFQTHQTRYCNLPAGTTKVRLLLDCSGGVASNTYVANFDNVVVNVV